MGRPEQGKFVANSQIVTSSATVGTTAPSPFQLTTPFPVGDICYNSLDLSFTGGLALTAGGGTIVTDGGLQFIRALYFSTPQHTMIVEGLDGIMLHDMQRIKEKFAPIHVDAPNTIAGNAGASQYYLKLGFLDQDAFNEADLKIDVLRSGNPLLQINLGTYSDFVSGGAAGDTVNKFNCESSLQMDPGPVTPPDLPTQFMPYLGVLKVPIASTVAQYQIFLAFGDRIYKRIFITQRNGSTLARLGNTVVGASETDRISLKINSNFPWQDRIEWLALQAKNAQDSRLAAMPTGVAYFDFSRRIMGGVDQSNPNGGGAGAKLSDALSVLSKNQGTVELDVDVTSVSNGQLWIGYDAVKVLPLGARRPAPQPAGT